MWIKHIILLIDIEFIELYIAGYLVQFGLEPIRKHHILSSKIKNRFIIKNYSIKKIFNFFNSLLMTVQIY